MLFITQNPVFRRFLAAVFGLVLLIHDVGAKPGESPNVIYILADDLGFGDLGCYGQRTLSTPRIDQMAGEGIRFMRHYSGSTVCAPSRCVLMTGLHTGHARVRGNNAVLMHDDDLTVAKLFKQNGYTTGCFGKWGIGHPPPYDDPHKKGFDQFFGYINMWHAHNFWPEFLIENGKKLPLPNKVLDKYDQPADKEGRGVATTKKVYAPNLITEKALNFIDENKDNKFFLFFALNMPHANNEAGGDEHADFDGMEVPDHGEFSDKPWPRQEKGFARMMQLIDSYTGQILDRLTHHGIDQNTLVIFTSDNGPHQEGRHKMEFFNSNGQLRGMKRDLFEGGIHVPMIVRWPGKIRAGSVTSHVSAFQDLLPTVSDLLGLNSQNFETDGISFLPALLGQEHIQPKHPYLYWEFHERGGRQAVILGDFKGVRYNTRTNPDSPLHLYNLKSDLREQNNIAKHHPDIVRAINSILDSAHTPPDL